jgi:hypothetical protein
VRTPSVDTSVYGQLSTHTYNPTYHSPGNVRAASRF